MRLPQGASLWTNFTPFLTVSLGCSRRSATPETFVDSAVDRSKYSRAERRWVSTVMPSTLRMVKSHVPLRRLLNLEMSAAAVALKCLSVARQADRSGVSAGGYNVAEFFAGRDSGDQRDSRHANGG